MELDHLEDNGIGDQLSEMQQFSLKIFDGTKVKCCQGESACCGCVSIWMMGVSKHIYVARERSYSW